MLAQGIIESRLAACVNIIPGVVSHYRWEGRLHRDGEVMLIIKTKHARLKALQAWVKAHHPYSVPEFIVIPVASGSREYLHWVEEQTK